MNTLCSNRSRDNGYAAVDHDRSSVDRAHDHDLSGRSHWPLRTRHDHHSAIDDQGSPVGRREHDHLTRNAHRSHRPLRPGITSWSGRSRRALNASITLRTRGPLRTLRPARARDEVQHHSHQHDAFHFRVRPLKVAR